MMKYVLLFALVAVATARPQSDIQLVSSNNENQGDGNYQWDFKTSDGTEQQATGSLSANPDPKAEFPQVQNVQGSYSFPADGKTKVLVTYVSGPNGYRPKTVISN